MGQRMCRSRKIPDLAKAMAMLSEHGYSCVFCSGQKQYTSHGRGVMPLIHFLSSGTACAPDQVDWESGSTVDGPGRCQKRLCTGYE